MILTIWNEAEKVRHSIALELLWNNRQQISEKKLALVAGNVLVRYAKIPAGDFAYLHFNFNFSHFIQFTNDSANSNVLVYAFPLDENTRGISCRMEWLQHESDSSTLFLRGTSQSVLLVQLPTYQENKFPLERIIAPCCPEAQQVLRQMMDEKLTIYQLQEQWKRFSTIFQRELYIGSRFHTIPGQHLDKIRSAATKIMINPGSPKSIRSIAQAEGISGTYLKMYFRQFFGQSIHEFQHQYRMQLACRLMSETTFTLQDIAILCGYNDGSSFVKAFRNYFGLAPFRAFR